MLREKYDLLVAKGKLNKDGQPLYLEYDSILWHLQTNRAYYKSIDISPFDPAYCRLLHQYIWEKANGPIPKDHIIHHIDNNPYNNSIDNLKLVTRSEHTLLHPYDWPLSSRQKVSQQKMGNKCALGAYRSPETRQKISKARYLTLQKKYLFPYLSTLVACNSLHSYLHGNLLQRLQRWIKRTLDQRRP